MEDWCGTTAPCALHSLTIPVMMNDVACQRRTACGTLGARLHAQQRCASERDGLHADGLVRARKLAHQEGGHGITCVYLTRDLLSA